MTRRHWKQSKSTLVQRVRLQSLSKDRRIDLGMNYCDMRKGRLAAGKFSGELQGRLVFSTLNRNLFQIRRRSIQTHHFPINFSPLHKILTEMTIDNFFEKYFLQSYFRKKCFQAAVRTATDMAAFWESNINDWQLRGHVQLACVATRTFWDRETQAGWVKLD